MKIFEFNNYDVIYDINQITITWSPNASKKEGGIMISGTTLDEALSKFKLASNVFTVISNIIEVEKLTVN